MSFLFYNLCQWTEHVGTGQGRILEQKKAVMSEIKTADNAYSK